jgi:hypothetical protein
MQREHFSLFTDFACDHLDNRREISILLAPLAAFAPNGQPRSFPPWGYCAADRAVALFLGARDWRAAEASLQVPALARFLGRSQPASQLARCGGNRARSRSLLGALATCFATRSLWRRSSRRSPTQRRPLKRRLGLAETAPKVADAAASVTIINAAQGTRSVTPCAHPRPSLRALRQSQAQT